MKVSPPTAGVTYQDRAVGCILAGAVGDALGAPVEFSAAAQIEAEFGPSGPSDYGVAFGARGVATDDTQMTLFTLEGLVRAHIRYRMTGSMEIGTTVHRAYLRWLYTQGDAVPRSLINGQLVTEPLLFAERAPGNTCLSALRATVDGERLGTIERPINNSKGCGAVMRAAPAALWPGADVHEVFRIAAETGALTHGHPSGYLSAGTLAVIVHGALQGEQLPEALGIAEDELRNWPGHEEQLRALAEAQRLAAEGRPKPGSIAARLGGGWVGEEALAIAVCAALSAEDLRDGLRIAVNHSGDSDSTGSICGNILGAMYGPNAIPDRLRGHVDLGGICSALTLNALTEFTGGQRLNNYWLSIFPPG